jgi:hypothetical protein
VSLLGPIAIRFAYYHCARCGQGYQPWCGTLRLDKRTTLTPAAEEISSLAGILGSFADGAERVLRKMSGLRLSESTIERTTEAAGQRVAAQLEGGQSLGPTAPWTWQKDAMGQRCAYVSLDATGVRQQGPDGTRADGKMA